MTVITSICDAHSKIAGVSIRDIADITVLNGNSAVNADNAVIDIIPLTVITSILAIADLIGNNEVNANNVIIDNNSLIVRNFITLIT